MQKMQLLLGDQAFSVPVDTKSALLDQVLSQGLRVNYSCRRGDCGQCVGTLLEGRVDPQDPAKAFLRDADVYLCNALPRSDLTIRLPYSPETAHVKVLRTPCKIHELTRLSEDVLEVSLRLPPSVEFRYVPGQYLRLTNKDRVSRSYSLAQAPALDKLLFIHVRRIDAGTFSDYLFLHARPGDLLQIEGPMGRFVLPDVEAVSRTIFLATGTGIAPIHAILSGLSFGQRQRSGELFLYWGNRIRADAYFQGRLESLVQNLDLRYRTVFSRESLGDSEFRPRHVQDLMVAEHAGAIHEARVFASGNLAMIDAARELSRSLGLPPERFHADPFTAS